MTMAKAVNEFTSKEIITNHRSFPHWQYQHQHIVTFPSNHKKHRSLLFLTALNESDIV